MILALVVVLAATFVLAGWATMLATRTIFTEEAADGQKRRLAMQNARSMGMQWARQGIATNTIANVSAILDDNWGQFAAVTAASNIFFTSLTNSSTNINHFGPMGIGGFSIPVTASLVGQGFTNNRIFFFRSRSPLYGGYPLTAQTNTAVGATNFAGVRVDTNGIALMFANAAGTSSAPAAPAYSFSANRTVVITPGSSTLAPASRFPFVPVASGPTGTNTAFSGQLPTEPARTFTVNQLRTAVDAAYSTVNVTVTDPQRSPTSSAGQFRILGTLPSYGGLQKTVQQLSTTLTPNLIVIGNAPSAGYTQVDANRVRIAHYGRTYDFRVTATGTQFLDGSTWRTFSSGNYVRVQSQDSTIQQFAKPMTATGITLNDSSGNRTVVFAPQTADLIAIRSNSITFNGTSGNASTGIDAAVLYTKTSYQQNSGVSFILLGRQVSTTSFYAQQRLYPKTFKARAIVDGFPLVQLDTATTYTFRDPSNVDIVRFSTTGSQKLQVRAGNSTESPVLAHVAQDEFASDTTFEWRKALLVFDASNTINVENSSSALTFSYFDSGEMGIALDTGSNGQRPLYLAVTGRSGVADTGTTLTGGGNRTWRLGATFVNSPLTMSGGNFTITGGIRSNRNIFVSGSGVTTLGRQTTTTALEEFFADRVGWIESWQP